MPTATELREVGEELASSLRSWREGSVIVERVTVEVAEDRDGIPAVNLTAVLADPPSGLETWRLEDLLPLRRGLRARVAELALDAPVYLWFKPTSDPPQDES